MKTPKQEPVLYSSLVPVVLGAFFVLLKSFGVNFTQEQQTAIITVIVLLVPVVAYFVRNYVTPWQANNPLVNFPEDLTGLEPGADASKKQASE